MQDLFFLLSEPQEWFYLVITPYFKPAGWPSNKYIGEKNDIYTIKTAMSILNRQLGLLGHCQNSLTDIVRNFIMWGTPPPPILTPATSNIVNMSTVKSLLMCMC